MSGFTAVALGGFLVGVFLFLVAILMWQEAKRRRGRGEVIYVISDALQHIRSNLTPQVWERVGEAGIQRIIEWEIFYLQGLAQKNRRLSVETVAGGSEPSITYISRQIAKRHRIEIPSDDIRAVLELEAEYLQSIGAVGSRIDPVAQVTGEEKG